MEEMTRLELLTLLYYIQALMETGNTEKAKEIKNSRHYTGYIVAREGRSCHRSFLVFIISQF